MAFDRGEQIALQDDHPILDAVQDSVRAGARDGNRFDVGRCNLVTALRGEDGKNSASCAKIERRSPSYTTYTRYTTTITQLIQCMRLTPVANLQPREHGKAHDLDGHDAQEYLADVRETVDRLLLSLEDVDDWRPWRSTIERRPA